jgi:hypothetical protein
MGANQNPPKVRSSAYFVFINKVCNQRRKLGSQESNLPGGGVVMVFIDHFMCQVLCHAVFKCYLVDFSHLWF